MIKTNMIKTNIKQLKQIIKETLNEKILEETWDVAYQDKINKKRFLLQTDNVVQYLQANGVDSAVEPEGEEEIFYPIYTPKQDVKKAQKLIEILLQACEAFPTLKKVYTTRYIK